LVSDQFMSKTEKWKTVALLFDAGLLMGRTELVGLDLESVWSMLLK